MQWTQTLKPTLSPDNYRLWKGNFAAVARKKEFIGIMTGKEKRPTEEGDKRDDFDKRADIGAGELYLALDDSQKVKVEGMEDDVKKMWDYLYAQHILKRPATRLMLWMRSSTSGRPQMRRSLL